MLKDNLTYLNHSAQNPEPALDENYMFLEQNPELDTYIARTKEIKALLITIKQLLAHAESEAVLEKYFEKLFDLFQTKYNASEFRNFISACDTSLNAVQKDYASFKIITKLYLRHRELNNLVPGSWVQALLDSHSPRKQGSSGELKLKSLLERYGYREINNLAELNKVDKCFGSYKEGITVQNIDQMFNTTLEEDFKEGKKLDLLIKSRRHLFLLEAKHLNTLFGGTQGKQINELIDLIKLNYDTVHLVAFLDGNGSDELLDPKGMEDTILRRNGQLKANRQREDIYQALKRNPNNFWLNTAGFLAVLDDLE